MAALTECPDCASWNPPQATRCRSCGRGLRGPERGERRDGERTGRELPKGRDHLRSAVATKAPASRRDGTGTSAEAEVAVAGSGGDGLGRIPTHIGGLDEALGGGLPAGYVIVLEGAPGTMKSSLGFWIVAHNCPDGKRALYVSAEEGTASLLRQMRALGVDMDAAGRGVKILEPRLLRRILAPKGGDWLAGFRGAVDQVREDGGLDFLVIDSLDALEVLAGFHDRRQELFRLFEWLRDAGLTTMVIAERPDFVVQGNVFQGRYDEDFLADGVLTLRLHAISDQEVQRRLRIVKMRGTRHETGYLALHVGGGEFEVGRVLSA